MTDALQSRPGGGPRALARVRLDHLLEPAASGGTVLVTGPAGAGKTTAVADWLVRSGTEAGWVDADVAQAALPTLGKAIAAAAAGPGAPPPAATDVAAALAGAARLVVIDGAHALRGTEAEVELGRALATATRGVVLISRELPAFDVSRLRLAERLVEIGADELRFRSWEVEQLFRDVYGQALLPAEIAELARRTEGWAAGLQLFHLATRGRAPAERRRLLGVLSGRSRFLREYLAANVLATLPGHLRRFLLDTCPLSVLTAPLCDAVRGAPGSRPLLEELEHTGVFTVSVDEGRWRYHEVFRSHLELALADEVGEVEARQRHATAGRYLEAAGEAVGALRAYARAGDEEAVARVLRAHGATVASAPGGWIDALPDAVRDSDPWILLATARRQVASGRWRGAAETYGRARVRFGQSSGAETCVRERHRLAQWLEPVSSPPAGAEGLLRAGTREDPLGQVEAAAALEGIAGRLTAAVLCLLGGHLPAATALAEAASRHPDADTGAVAAAALVCGVVRLVGGNGDEALFEEAAEAWEATGVAWLAALARLARAAIQDEPGDDLLALRQRFLEDGNPWGAGLAALLSGLACAAAERPTTVALTTAVGDAAAAFQRLGAAVPAAWCRAVNAALAGADAEPTAGEQAARARADLRRLGVRPPGLLARALAGGPLGGDGALARDPGRAADALEPALARTLSRLGVELPAGAATPAGSPARVVLRCFGGFALEVDGRPVHLDDLRPRAQSLLRLLALHAGAGIHRETLVEALWPAVEPSRGLRRLHVALSSLRSALAAGGLPDAIVRQGDSYRIDLPASAEVDDWRLREALAAVRSSVRQRDLTAARRACETALAIHRGPLLPEEGPAEWVVVPREQVAADLVEAAHAASDLLLRAGDHLGAAWIARHALAIDGTRSTLWEVLVRAHEVAGELHAADRARQAARSALGRLDDAG